MPRVFYLVDAPVTLGECPPGLFVFRGAFGMKTEYKTESESTKGFWQSDTYCVDGGEYFWGGESSPAARERLMVTPIVPTPEGSVELLDIMPFHAAQICKAIEDMIDARIGRVRDISRSNKEVLYDDQGRAGSGDQGSNGEGRGELP